MSHLIIQNKILEALARTNMGGHQTRVFIAILRKTYGWGKSQDYLTGSQISKMTHLHKSHVSRALSKLVEKKIVIRKGKIKAINTNFDEWE